MAPKKQTPRKGVERLGGVLEKVAYDTDPQKVPLYDSSPPEATNIVTKKVVTYYVH